VANRRITELPSIQGAILAEQDLLTLVRVFEVDPTLKNKKITLNEFSNYLNTKYLTLSGGVMTGALLVQANATISGALTVNQITGGDIVSTTTVKGPTLSGTTVTGNTGQFTSGLFTFISVTATGKSGFGTAVPVATVDVVGNYTQNITSVAALDLDLSTSNYFTKTINANSTFTVSNTPSSRAYSFTLELTHTSGTITWFSGVEWPGGVSPILTTGKTHLFMFVTDDGGTRWRGASLTNYTT
jgi:hypothetical protein